MNGQRKCLCVVVVVDMGGKQVGGIFNGAIYFALLVELCGCDSMQLLHETDLTLKIRAYVRLI